MTHHSSTDPYDPHTGTVRVLARKCDTCIFRPGNHMHLVPGRQEQLAAQAIRNDTYITCHDTLPYAVGVVPGPPAICRGFWDVHKKDSRYTRLVLWANNMQPVPPPAKENP